MYLPDDEVSVPQLAWLLQVPRETIEEGLQRIGAVSGLREATIDRAEAGLLAGVYSRARARSCRDLLYSFSQTKLISPHGEQMTWGWRSRSGPRCRRAHPS